MESRSHYRAARPTEQLALGVVLLHAPLTASRTRGQALLARLDTRSSLGLLLVGSEPALLRSLHLRHDFTMRPKKAVTQEVHPEYSNTSADAILRGAGIPEHALHGGWCRRVGIDLCS